MALYSKPPLRKNLAKNHCESFSIPRPVIILLWFNYRLLIVEARFAFVKTCLFIRLFRNLNTRENGGINGDSLGEYSWRQGWFTPRKHSWNSSEGKSVGRAARQSISRNDETEASSIVARGSRTQTVLLTTMRGRNGGRVETKQIIVRPIGAWQDSRV